jgi:opacity protein-like surface antigen
MKWNRILLSASVLFITLFGNAQTLVQEVPSKISIGLTQSFDLGYRISSADAASTWMKNISDSIETPTLTYSSAVKLQFDLNEKISLRTGIVYAQKGFKYKSGSLAGFDQFKEKYSLIEVPIQVLYKLGENKIKPYVSIGTSIGYLINSQAFYTLENSTKEVKMPLSSDLTKLQVNGILGMGMSFSLDQKWTLITELKYTQALYSISNGPLKKQLFTTGINIGLFRYF